MENKTNHQEFEEDKRQLVIHCADILRESVENPSNRVHIEEMDTGIDNGFEHSLVEEDGGHGLTQTEPDTSKNSLFFV